MNGQDDPAHILVVDDDARLRALLQRFLTEQGFRVSTAEMPPQRGPPWPIWPSIFWCWM